MSSATPTLMAVDAHLLAYIDDKLNDLGLPPEAQKTIKTTFVKYLSEQYGQLDDAALSAIFAATAKQLSEHKEELLTELTEARLTGLIAAGIQAVLDEQRIKLPPVVKQSEPFQHYIPFGYLATDHAGYLSFDIEKALKQYANAHSGVKTTITYWMYPNGDMGRGLDISAQGRVTADYVYGNVALTKPAKSLKSLAYHSLQNPGLIDWYLSPSSFSINPRFMIGQDGCEQLYPANFATSEFRFFQIVRGPAVPDNAGLRTGFAYEYNAVWQPLGHTLGQIVYTLPLAPGEIVKIGIIDWRRQSDDSRQEDTTESEDLTHNTYRDRTIGETVNASLNEWQRGSSFMAGDAGGAGVSYGTGAFGATASNTHSFGGGYSTSSGDRDLTVSTVQQVNDAFSQHSSAIRELRSTVVVQSTQAEYARAETRVIANNNHSHALTMLYYEVLRHYRVTTQFIRRRKVLLVDYSAQSLDFNDDYAIIRCRRLLEAFLTEARYLPGFDALQKYLGLVDQYNLEVSRNPENAGNTVFKNYRLYIKTGDDGLAGGKIYIRFFTFNQGYFDLLNPEISRLWFEDGFGANQEVTLNDVQAAANGAWSPKDLKWSELRAIQFRLEGGDSWLLSRFVLEGQITETDRRTLYDGAPNYTLVHDTSANTVQFDLIQPALPPQIPLPLDRLSDEERVSLNALKRHLVGHAAYYNRIIWLNEDANDRAQRFADIPLDNASLLDKIENRPIDVLGNFIVFPSNYGSGNFTEDEAATYQRFKAKVEKLMTLPTRGVFGEAKLGHCNASELIDNTRFWDWQQSPILEKAPDIDPLNTDSRNVTQNLAPTPFPAPVVNIVNPAPAPDPTAMAGALTLLGKSDIFRDMSLGSEVGDLLKKLSDNSIDFAEAANAAKGILAKNADKSGGAAPGTSEAGKSTASGAQMQPSPTSITKPQDLMDWMNAVKNSGMSPGDKKDVIQDVKEGAKKTVNPKPIASAKEKVTKAKTFVFQSFDYKGATIEFQIKATVHDILDNKTVAENAMFTGHGQLALSFSSATPIILIFLTTDPIVINTQFFQVNIPKINMQNEGGYQLKDTQEVVFITLKQKSIDYAIEAKTTEEAATNLANEYGGKLGFDKVVAAEIIAKSVAENNAKVSNETLKKYKGILPDNVYDMIVK